MELQFLKILAFAVVGVGFFSCLLMVVAPLVRERSDRKDASPYECGMPAEGSPWVSPNIRFYVFALLFVIFDVEALFVFPWAVTFREAGVAGFGAVMIFVGAVFAGLVYAWKKAALKWE
jgi:NADH-quinone oxidoreductase subunit A